MAEITAGKQRGRPFRRGESGNSAGRPVGARHKATVAAETLLDGEAEGLTRKVLEMALSGSCMGSRYRRTTLATRSVTAGMPTAARNAGCEGECWGLEV